MHIKQITISNFRSFRQQPEIHPFNSATNCVVGRNGSGKSNLFDAVQFVLLAPKFYTLRTEERQALLHEGSGAAAVNAFVEIVFDNSDNRFSLESDEVVLRRTVGHKKDEFFLQRKRANKNEIMSLLEGAGFSKSNPYFIVQQGKVNALCTMSDSERLQLLKEVAGTTVYDEKKNESLTKMGENKSSIEKINETLSYMEERLGELRGEKEELTKYQQLDRERRALEYTLYDKELRKARETLDEIEHTRAEEIEARSLIFEEGRATEEAIATLETEMKTKTNMLRRNTNYLTTLEDDNTVAMTLKTKLELRCKELEEAVQMSDRIMEANKLELQTLEIKIVDAQKELDLNVQPKFESFKDTLAQMINEREDASKKIEGIYAKQGRSHQFTSKKDRDAFLRSQIKDLTDSRKQKLTLLSKKNESLQNLYSSVESGSKEMELKTVDLKKQTQAMDELSTIIEEKKKVRNDMAESRKEQWRELEESKERLHEARDKAHRAFSNLRKIMPRATANGLDALSQIVEEEKIIVGEQYFGLLMQNFELTDEKFRTAVEVAAQNSLFHVIVDNDETAARLMSRLERGRLGRVTFLPLNQLRIENVKYPDSSDVSPMLLRCINYDQRVHRAMHHVFGRKLLARSVDVASTWSTQSNMDGITLDGDLCSRKGALTGGYVDAGKSRLNAHAELQIAESALKSLDSEHRNMEQKNSKFDKQVSSLMGEIQRFEAKNAKLERIIGRTEEEITKLARKLEKQKNQIEVIESDSLPPIQTEINALEHQIHSLQEEMGTELKSDLSDEDRSLLVHLKDLKASLVEKIESQSQAMEEISVERQRLQSLLNDNLLKRKQELIAEGSGTWRNKSSSSEFGSRVVQAKRKEELEQCQRELNDAIQAILEIAQKLEDAKISVNELRTELTTSKNSLEKLRAKDMANSRALEKAQEREERLMNKRSMCVSKRESYMTKIQELGSLPPTSELASFTKLSISALMRQLESINKKLKKYSHVNKKAYDQFVNFSEQRESLLKRKDELDRGAEKVQELIDSLDRQKDEAINRTFRGVSAHFKDVFKELVPLGAGEIIMKTSEDVTKTDGEDSSVSGGNKKQQIKVQSYKGIGVKVRFSAVGENYMMSQLSGGQKALVALALIFSIQRCDPAPFYLFDELDQALDSTYRAAVAGVIQRQANSEDNPTQFICSTFRPELVTIANNCYGISHQNKVSSVHHLSKKDALHFIANLMNEEEAVGEASTIATSRAAASVARKRKAIADSHDQTDLQVAH